MKAIVTGYTKGLGEAVTRILTSRNIPVLGLARSAPALINGVPPALLTQAQVDLGDAQSLIGWLNSPTLTSFIGAASEILLINNAGTIQPVGALHDQDPLAVAKSVTLNVAAPLLLAAAVVRASPGKHRRILHISSGAGSSAYPGWSVYCASKAALDHHARAVALDAEDGVRICSLAPGVIDTGMQAEIRASPAERFPMRQRFVDMKQGGQLLAPTVCAEHIVEYLLAPDFGQKPVDDLRNATNRK